MPAILEIDQLYKSFGPVRAVNGISFSIDAGECFGLLGPNGAGKTTTLEIIEGISEADSGTIRYKNRQQHQQLSREAGIQFQSTSLPDFLTARDTLQLFGQFYSRTLPVDQLVALCDLDEFIDQRSTKLSGGQRQRLLLAIALINDPEILFLDEPTTGLDPHSRQQFWTLINNIKQQGKTLVLTTHYMDEAEKLCDRLAIMDHGKIVAEGSPQQLLNQHFDYVRIRIDDIDLRHPGLGNLKDSISSTQGGIEILSRSVEQTMHALLAENIDLQSMSVHSPTLDDLFIKLTGHSLRSQA